MQGDERARRGQRRIVQQQTTNMIRAREDEQVELGGSWLAVQSAVGSKNNSWALYNQHSDDYKAL